MREVCPCCVHRAKKSFPIVTLVAAKSTAPAGICWATEHFQQQGFLTKIPSQLSIVFRPRGTTISDEPLGLKANESNKHRTETADLCHPPPPVLRVKSCKSVIPTVQAGSKEAPPNTRRCLDQRDCCVCTALGWGSEE